MNETYIILLFVLIILIAILLFQRICREFIGKYKFFGGSSRINTREPSLDEVIRIIKEWSLVRDDPRVISIMKTGKTIKEVVTVLRSVDGHSGYHPPSIITKPTTRDNSTHPLPNSFIKESIGYLSIPFLYDTDANSPSSIEVATKIAEALESFKDVKKIVINLEKNEGGNIWPMRRGLHSILSNGSWSGAVYVDGSLRWTNADGTNTPEFRNNTTKFANIPIEVIVGPETASSGEIIAIDLLSNPNVTITGLPTYGMLSSNEVIPLKNGGKFIVKIALIVNPRTQKTIIDEKIIPATING